MTAGKLVPKRLLIDQIRRTVIDGESGFFTILTDQKRSIMFRFSEGKLIHSHCRSRDVANAIEAIVECEQLKFSQADAQMKASPEVIAAEVFLESIDPGYQHQVQGGGSVIEDVIAINQVEIPVLPRATNPELQGVFCEIARDYIGMVANILVSDVFAKKLSIDATIDEIAGSIPVADHAESFRQRVRSLEGVREHF